MMQNARAWAIEELPWLPARPDDFRARCDAIDGSEEKAQAIRKKYFNL